jgi:hypothetical protein
MSHEIGHIDLIWESCVGCTFASKPFSYKIVFKTGNIKLLSVRKLPQKNRGHSSHIRYRFEINTALQAIPTITFEQTQEGSRKKNLLSFQYRNGKFE